MLTPIVKATLFAPTPTRPTPARERMSRRPGLPSPGSRSATSARSRSPARVNLIATKGTGGNSATATLTATGLVPRKRTARSSEASTSVAALSLRPAMTPSLPSWHSGHRLVGCSFLRSRVRLTAWNKISLPRRDALSGLLLGQGGVIGCKKLFCLSREVRAPPVVALSDVASQLAKLLELLVGLYALGDHLDAQRVPEIDRRPHDSQVLVVRLQISHEHPVQLQLVHRQVPQVRQRRVPHPEVVYCQPHPKFLEALERACARSLILDQDALCDLQRKASGVEGSLPQGVLHFANEFWITQLTSGDIHGHGQLGVLGIAFLPLLGAPAGLVEHPPTHRDYQARLLSYANESRRDKQTLLRMGPPQQRLDPYDRAVGYRDHWLVEDG